AMKMENDLRSEVEGIVTAVRVQPGQTVERGELLVVIEPPKEDGGETSSNA
ncbi:MAG: acetyl-CoA carboxylase biotin carboxyl carrier protein subunit, partial [Gemmatimonadetes bacterium]|nr:acetyl-CoA carboxylase biotin carboxyl carrier protein subunit [Gemmatimonadota bacterium]